MGSRGSNDLSLRDLLTVSDTASGGIKGFGSVLGGLLGPLGLASAGMLGFGAISIAALAKSVQMAGDYQQAMNSVAALTGASQQQMAYYDAGLKQLAIDAGVAPTQLTSGLYNVLSASFKGAEAMKVLTLATEDAKIGMTSAKVATDGLTNILRAFSVQSGDITRVNGEMLSTVTLGKATFEEYASTIVKAADASVQFHVPMETMNAAWATLTSSGLHAAQASTDYVQSLKVMYGNIGTVTASLHKHGIAFNEAAFNAMDYGHKIQYLNAAVEQANEKHVRITGVTLQAAQALSVISNHMKNYNDNLATLSNKQSMAQKTAQAWAITQSGFNQTMDRLNAAFAVLAINIGTLFLPLLTALVAALIPVVMAFANWVLWLSSLQLLLHDKLTPAMKLFTEAIQWTGYYFDRLLRPVTKNIRDEMYSLWQTIAAPGQLNDAFKQTSDWMLSVGTPVYTAYAAVVGDVLGGAYQKLGRDIANAALSTPLAALKVDTLISQELIVAFKHINWPAIFASIPPLPVGLFAGLFGPIGGGAGGIALLFQGLFGKIDFHAIFQPFVDEWNQVMQDLFPSFVQFVLWWQNTMGPLFKGLGDAWLGTKKGVDGAVPPLKQVLDIFGHVFEFMAKMNMIIIEEVLPNTIKFFTWLGDALFKSGGSLHWLWTAITAFTTWLAGDGASYVRTFFDLIGKIFLGIGGVLTWLKDTALPAVQRVWGGIGEWAGAIWLMIIQFWGLLEPWLWAFAQGIKWVTDTIDSIPGWVADALDAVWWAFSEVLGKIHQLWGNIGKWFQDRGGDINNGITRTVGGIGKWFGDRWNDVQRGWGIAGKWFQDRGQDIWRGITIVFGPIGHWFQDRWQDVKNIWGTVGQWFQDRGKDAYNLFVNAFSGIGQAIENAFKGALNWVIGGLNRIIDGYNNVPKFGIPNIAHVPSLATGGYLTSGGIVDVHKDERLFLPASTMVAGAGSMLARGSGSRGSGGHTYIQNNTISISVSGRPSRADLEAMADDLDKIFAKKWRGNANIQIATSGSVRG